MDSLIKYTFYEKLKIITSLLTGLAIALTTIVTPIKAATNTKVLFIGNSFTFGYGSASKHYRADSVIDFNKQGIGGVPALFKSFTDQANLNYDVFSETRGGSALDYHIENKLDLIGLQPWYWELPTKTRTTALGLVK